MTDNELNSLIAEKVMGLRNVRSMYGQAVYDMIHTYAMDNEGQETITYQPAPIPDYANDIAAAFKIVEHMTSKGYEFALIADVDRSDEYAAEFDDFDGNIGETTYMHGERDKSPSRAICLAALAAIGVNYVKK